MHLQLFSIDQTPRTLPIWEAIREDLSWPDADRIAQVLGVGISTVYRWNAAGRAPRVACLALFWLTRWGRSEVHTRATNDAMLAATLARSLHEERDTLRLRLASAEIEANELRAVRNDLALRLAHGSDSSAHPSRTGTCPEDWAAVANQLLPALLQALARAEPARPARLEFPLLIDLAAAGPGSPEAPPPRAHSGISLGTPHTPQPGLSAPPAAARSSSPSDTSSAPLRGDGVIVPPDCNQIAFLPPLLEEGASARSAAGNAEQGHRGATRSHNTPPPSREGADVARAAPVHTAGTLPPQTAGSHEGAQAPGRLASQVTRVVAGRVASIAKLEVARPAQSAESLHRGLNGPFNGATPHTPAPGAPEAGAGAFGQLAGTLTRHRPAGAKGARQ